MCCICRGTTHIVPICIGGSISDSAFVHGLCTYSCPLSGSVCLCASSDSGHRCCFFLLDVSFYKNFSGLYVNMTQIICTPSCGWKTWLFIVDDTSLQPQHRFLEELHDILQETSGVQLSHAFPFFGLMVSQSYCCCMFLAKPKSQKLELISVCFVLIFTAPISNTFSKPKLLKPQRKVLLVSSSAQPCAFFFIFSQCFLLFSLSDRCVRMQDCWVDWIPSHFRWGEVITWQCPESLQEEVLVI